VHYQIHLKSSLLYFGGEILNMDYSRRQGKKVYKVKWKGCSRTTWEPGENIPTFLIRDFHVNKTQSGKMKKKHRRH
jgi:hypothetical protein